MVKLFIEGGGNNDALKTECRRGFTKLLERAGFAGRMPRLVACGGRQNAFEQFCTALSSGRQTDRAILLVDAECSVTCTSPWKHVAERQGDGWTQPAGATDEHLHFMVQCMEAWLLADRRALAEFYGSGFGENKLPSASAKPEEVSKSDLYRKLAEATKDSKTKGRYGKGEHSFKLLATVNPSLIRNSCPWGKRFFDSLDRLLK